MLRRLSRPFLRLAFHLFYNPFAFTYDFVSAVVSRGHWRGWTRAAIPYVTGTRILELPCGTGNLLLDLAGAGYVPTGVDLSPSMLSIAQGKLKRTTGANARLARARVQALPFPPRTFDTVVMTFPPEFIYDSRALAEFQRVLADGGRLLWVDAGRLVARDIWDRFLNTSLDSVGSGEAAGRPSFEHIATTILGAAGFRAQVEWIHDEASRVAVVIATKEEAE